MNVLRCEVINLPAFQTLQTLPAASRERPPWLCPQSRHTPGTRLSQNSGLTIGSVMQGALGEHRSNHVLNASDVGSNSICVILITSLHDAEGPSARRSRLQMCSMLTRPSQVDIHGVCRGSCTNCTECPQVNTAHWDSKYCTLGQ